MSAAVTSGGAHCREGLAAAAQALASKASGNSLPSLFKQPPLARPILPNQPLLTSCGWPQSSGARGT